MPISRGKERSKGFDMGDTKICALVGSFSDTGLNIVYRDFQASRVHQDNIDLDIYERSIVKKQKSKGGSYVR